MSRCFPVVSSGIRWGFVALLVVGIVYGSLFTGADDNSDAEPTLTPPNIETSLLSLQHVVSYTILAAVLAYALASSTPDGVAVGIALGSTVVFGALLELVQLQLSYRYFSLLDIAANGLGALLGVGVFLLARHLCILFQSG